MYNKTDFENIIQDILIGNPVILPTETVYGIAVRYDNQESIDKLFQLKNRNKDKPISLHIPKEMLPQFNIPKHLNILSSRLFPGPFTLLINSKKKYGFHSQSIFTNKIGLRVPENEIFQQIMQRVNLPLCMTSVNLSNKKSASKFIDCINDFPAIKKHNILGVEDDANVMGTESIIIDTTKSPMYTIRT